MNRDLLLEAIRELRKMGFEVVSRDQGRIPEQDKEKIEADLQEFEKKTQQRLQALGLTVSDLMKDGSSIDALAGGDSDGNISLPANPEEERVFIGHELMAMYSVLLSIYCIQDDVRSGRIASLFENAVSLGESLPDGCALHRYDVEGYWRYKAQKGGKNSKRKPWADALAQKICDLRDDDIYWRLAGTDSTDEEFFRFETERGEYEIQRMAKDERIEAAPVTRTKEGHLVQDTSRPIQSLKFDSFIKYYVRPARKNIKKR